MNYLLIASSLDQFEIRYLINLDSLILSSLSLSLTNIGLYLTLVVYILLVFILVNNLIGMIPYSFASTSYFILTFSLSFTVVLGVTTLGSSKHELEFFSLLITAGCVLCLWSLMFLIGFISYLAKNVLLGLFTLAANIKWGFNYPTNPSKCVNTPIQSRVFFYRNFLASLKIKFKDPKFWMNWLCTVTTIMSIRCIYIYSGLDIGWVLECFSLSSIGFFTRQIFSLLFDAATLPLGIPSTLYMDNPGNPSSSNAVNSGYSGNQRVQGSSVTSNNPLTEQELKEIISNIASTTQTITLRSASIQSKIENLEQGYTRRKYDSLVRTLDELNAAQTRRNTLFGDVYARNGNVDALEQIQYPRSVHNRIIDAQNTIERYRGRD